MQGSIYTHSHFKPEQFNNGGCKRTAQIREILNKNNILYEAAGFEPYKLQSKSISSYIRGIVHNKKINFNIRNDHNIGHSLKAFERFVKQTSPSLFIWESVESYHLLLSEVLYSKKIPFIALPHNIESLVRGNTGFNSSLNSPDWLTEEIKYLKYSNKVFTISYEEQWLLSLYGIDADYLPYYPTNDVKTYLLSIRKEREKKEKNGLPKKLLLLGTFYNRPTMQGYLDLLKHASKFKDFVINIAGFGSEALGNFNSPNIKNWGSVSKEILKEIIIDNDAVILHQEPTTGALTKIPELLIAGIPIIANQTASRNYHALKGISTYFNLQELSDLIHTIHLTMPPIPSSPELAEKRFIDTVKTFYKV